MTLHVACISVSAALGGSERVLFDFVTRARPLGIEPVVVVPKAGPLVQSLGQADIPVLIAHADDAFLDLTQRRALSFDALALVPRGLAVWATRIRRVLAAHYGSPEPRLVLYSNGFKAHLSCGVIRGHRRVWHLHEFPPGRFLAPAWRFIAQTLPHSLIANSASVAASWRIPGLREPTTVLNGVDLQRFAPAPRTGWVHRELGIAPDVRLIGMPAVFARWKGQVEVIDAFARIADDVPDAHLLLVGGTIYDTASERGFAAELVRRVKGVRRAVADRIHFLKFQADPWRLYPELDVTVHFSLRAEPFGRVIVESLACGVPVIAARAGGPVEIVEHGLTGWLVRPGDVASLGRQMVQSMAADRSPMAVAARRHAEAHFSAERFAREVADVLHRVGGR